MDELLRPSYLVPLVGADFFADHELVTTAVCDAMKCDEKK